MLKNNKSKKKEIGSKTTPLNDLKEGRFKDIQTTDVQTPKSNVSLRKNHFNHESVEVTAERSSASTGGAI